MTDQEYAGMASAQANQFVAIPAILPGPRGFRGWSPVYAAVSDGDRIIQKVTDWTGGEGEKPATGLFVGANGLTTVIADAVDFRGLRGLDGIRGVTPKGVWSANTSFEKDDLVNYQGSTYRRLATGVEGSNFNPAQWELFASKGNDGFSAENLIDFWNASTNSPALTSAPAAKNSFYIVSTGGTQNITGSSETFEANDLLVSNGVVWKRISRKGSSVDPKQSPNLVISSYLTPDNVVFAPVSTNSLPTQPVFIRQTGSPVLSIAKLYRGFNFAVKMTLAATERVNYFSQYMKVGESTLRANDALMGGVFLEIPAGANITVRLFIRQRTGNTTIQAATEAVAVGGNWYYYRFTSPVACPNPSDGLVEFYIALTNDGTTSADVYFAAPALVKSAIPLSPIVYNGPEPLPVVPDVSGLAAREEVSAASYNTVKDFNFATQALDATLLTSPWSIGSGGNGTFAAPIQVVSKASPVGNKSVKISHQKRSSDNFITDRQLMQKIAVPSQFVGMSRLSFGYWIARESAEVSIEQALISFYSDAAGNTSIQNNVGISPIFTPEANFGDWIFVRFENVAVPAGTLSIQINLRTKFLTASTLTDTVKVGWIAGAVVAFSQAKLLVASYNLEDIATQIAKNAIDADKAANPTDVVTGVVSAQTNVFKDANFAGQTVGSTALLSPWVAGSGGASTFIAPFEVVEKSFPASNRAVKVNHSKRSADAFVSDFQLTQTVIVPTEGLGASVMSFAAWFQRDSLDISLQASPLSFYSDTAATALISNASTGVPAIGTTVGSAVLAKFENVAVPAGTKAVIIRIRTRFTGTALDTVSSCFIAPPVLCFGSAKAYALPYNFDERAKKIATEVATNLIGNGGGSSASIRTDKLSYGSRMRKTLSKLLSMSIDAQGATQPKFDNMVRMGILGDSITAQDWIGSHLVAGVSGSTDGRDFLGLEKKYPFANFHTTNFGVGGQSARHFRKHLWHQVINYDLDLIFISTWGNDQMFTWTNNTSEYYSSMEEIIKYIRKHTTADICLLSYSLYPRTYETTVGSPGYKIQAALAQKYDCEFIDIARSMRDWGAAQSVPFYSNESDIQEWVNRGCYNTNDVHPLSKGETLLARATAEHFPDVNALLTTFDWNAGRTNWAAKQPVTQAEAVFEYLDSSIKLSDESKFGITGVTNTERDSNEVLVSMSSAADGEYVELEFEGNAIDLVYSQAADGAAASITIDGLAPSQQSFCSIWYPDADVNNAYTAGSKREAQIRYVPAKWKVAETLTILMMGNAGDLSQTFDLIGSVSGTIISAQSTANPVKATLPDGSFLWIRPENWEGRTTNVYAGDKFYLRAFNAQCLPLQSMRTWSDNNGTDRRFPIITPAANLDNEYLIRFLYTSITAFRIDVVRRRDMTGETDTLNVITALGTGNVTDNSWSGGGLTISAAEMARMASVAVSGRRFYYWVHRKFSDTITCAGATAYKKVRLASLLENKKHTLRITKVGAGKLYLDSFRAFKPE